MVDLIIRRAVAADASRLNQALRALSNDLDDTHLASDDDIEAAGFGESPCFSALLAESQNAVVGVAMYSPFFSTTRGVPGVFVSELWVCCTGRG
jgi:hypothetical protein